MARKSKSFATTCRSAAWPRKSSAPISSVMRVRRERSSRCSKTCSWVSLPATTTVCSISASPRPAICSSCHPRLSWKMSETKIRQRDFPTSLPFRRQSRRRNAKVRSTSVRLKETALMNNLHRGLAPISDAAWSEIEEEKSRTIKRYLAGRRVVDVQGPGGVDLSAIGTGHLRNVAAPGDGVLARQREVKPLVELRVPFELNRQQIDDVERGANDSDWQPAKDAARLLAFAEDRAIFEGYAAAGIGGVRAGTSNPVMPLPADIRAYPDAIAQALSQLRLVGVNGPYSVLLSADAYTGLSETSDHGYPVLEHIKRLVDGHITGAPAISGAFVLTTRGGDFGLYIGEDMSIGYLSHDDKTVRLYLEESFTFLLLTTEASVALTIAETKAGTNTRK